MNEVIPFTDLPFEVIDELKHDYGEVNWSLYPTKTERRDGKFVGRNLRYRPVVDNKNQSAEHVTLKNGSYQREEVCGPRVHNYCLEGEFNHDRSIFYPLHICRMEVIEKPEKATY